jgi:hypothetical protein
MTTNKDIMNQAGLKLATIRDRVRKLGLPKRYEEGNGGRLERVYTPEESALIMDGRNFRATGRPVGTGRFYPEASSRQGGADA